MKFATQATHLILPHCTMVIRMKTKVKDVQKLGDSSIYFKVEVVKTKTFQLNFKAMIVEISYNFSKNIELKEV